MGVWGVWLRAQYLSLNNLLVGVGAIVLCSPIRIRTKDGIVLLLMTEILHYLEVPKLWDLWYIPYYA